MYAPTFSIPLNIAKNAELEATTSSPPFIAFIMSGIGGAARMLFTYTGGLYFAKYIMNKESMYSLFGNDKVSKS